ncbi:AraC family transcriptional regulator, partial [Mycobacterium sp. ITM-2017-0098]
MMSELARFAGLRDGVPVYSYPNEFSTSPVSLIELDHGTLRGRHIHEFPVLVYHSGTGLVAVVAA